MSFLNYKGRIMKLSEQRQEEYDAMEMNSEQHEQLHQTCGEDLLDLMCRFGLSGISKDFLDAVCNRQENAFRIGLSHACHAQQQEIEDLKARLAEYIRFGEIAKQDPYEDTIMIELVEAKLNIRDLKAKCNRLEEYINDHVHSFIDSDESEKLMSYEEWTK